MTSPERRFSAAGLVATSQSGEVPSDLWTGDYDLLICVSGWDKRSVAIIDATRLRAREALLVFFDELDAEGLRTRHDALLTAYATSVSSEFSVQRGKATDVKLVWEALAEKVRSVFRKEGRPLRVCISASACPRYHTLALLGVGVGFGFIKSLTIVYSDGVYPAVDEDQIEVAFTGGSAAVLPIPGLEGTNDPEKARFLLASVGFEGWRAMRAVSRAEPDRVGVLLPDPGSSAEYVERAIADNRLLLDEYAVSEERIVRAAASDAVAAWQALADRRLESLVTENCLYLCTGTKPHSIALALRAMQLNAPAVLYSVPEEFRVVPVECGRLHWRFDIEATSAPRPGT